MFLTENTTVVAGPDAEYAGEDHELTELTLEHARDLHNLSMSMIKLEHKAIVKNETTLLTEGVKEYFTKVLNKIKEYWAKFVAWLKHMVDVVVQKVFGPRKKWLDENKAKVVKPDYGDTKVSLDTGLLSGKVSKLVSEAEGLGADLVAGAKSGGTVDELRKKLTNDGKDSIANALRKAALGEKTEEVALTTSLVQKLIGVAEDTFANAPKFKEFEKIARATVTIAESEAKLADKSGGKDEATNKKIQAIQAVGPLASQLVTAAKSVNDRANSQAMSALVKALHSGPKKESTEPSTTGDLLGQFA